jgi:hypothetical protein
VSPARFGALVGGVEHTLFNLGPGTADLGLLGEVMLDGRGGAAPFSAFDDRWVAEIEARSFLNTDVTALLHDLPRGHFLTFRLSRFF